MKKFRRSLIVTVLILSMYVKSSFALLPAVILFGLPEAAVWLSATFHVAVGGALFYFSTSGNNKTVSGSNVLSPARVQWVDISSIPVTKESPAKVKVPASLIKAKAASEPTKYADLAAVNMTQTVPVYPGTVPYTAGNWVINQTWATNLNCGAGQCNTANDNRVFTVGGSYFLQMLQATPADRRIQYKLLSSGQLDDNSYAEKLANGDNTLKTEFSGDIDELIHSEPNMCSWGDEDSNPVAPANAATDNQIAALRAAGTSISAATAAAVAAQQAADYAAQRAAASPGDTGLQQAYLDAAARAAVAAAAAQQAAQDAIEDAEDDTPVVGGTIPAAYGDGTTTDIGARFGQFTDELKTSSLFSTPSRLIGNIPGGGTSSMDVSFGRFGSTTVDFSSWFGGSLVVLRFMCLFICTLGAVRIVTLKGGSG